MAEGGLRERQKEKRKQAIMVAAARLFQEQGFNAASMEDIAAAAELSVGTVYNYFKSKAEIGLAIYQADRDLVQGATDKVIANPPADPVDAICRMMETDFETEVGYLDRAVWSALFGASFTDQSSLSNAFVSDELMRVDQFRKLLQVLAAKGKIDAAADLDAAAEMLGALNLWYFMRWLAGLQSGTGDAAHAILSAEGRAALKRHITQLTRGLLA
ncbi:TetR family transcriptional regulator [Dongia mobilis]|uniref:TetR family transcriptional regulator n=2 Tax=Dongia mobilis TaxID=578943 RepID=A0A4V6PXK6_9PROT|nr:TetR family transcriptional regulator [Dongia mobilis]